MAKHTLTELNQMSQEELIMIILSMQGRLDALNENIEKLIEQVRIANSSRFGRRTETLSPLMGSCLSLTRRKPCLMPLQRNQRQRKYSRLPVKRNPGDSGTLT